MVTRPSTPSDAASKLTPEQNDAINRKSLDRQDAITEVTWKRGSAGLWGGGLVGAFWGTVFAAVTLAALATVGPIAVALAGGTATFASVMGFSMGGMFIPTLFASYIAGGIASGSTVGYNAGRAAGAVAGGMREQDRSAVARGKSIEPVPGEEPSLRERLNIFRGSKKLIDWKSVAFFGAIGIGLGALFLLAAPVVGGALGLMGATGGTGAAFLGMSALATETAVMATMAMWGGFWGVDNPTLVRNATDLAGYALSGKIWDDLKKSKEDPRFTRGDEKFLKEVGSGLGRSSQVQAPTVFMNTHQVEGAYLKPGANMQRVQQQEATRDVTQTLH